MFCKDENTRIQQYGSGHLYISSFFLMFTFQNIQLLHENKLCLNLIVTPEHNPLPLNFPYPKHIPLPLNFPYYMFSRMKMEEYEEFSSIFPLKPVVKNMGPSGAISPT